MGTRGGYIFSLDAFVAFSLILIAIQALLLMTSTPRSYYPALLQAEYLAKDSLEAMSIAYPPCTTGIACDRTYAELLYSGTGSTSALTYGCARGAKSTCSHIRDTLDQAIPPQYSYSFAFYDLTGNSWRDIYNASADDQSTHYNVNYSRVMASGQIFMIGYTVPVRTGQSPYCNVECHGWVAGDQSNPSPHNTSVGSCTKVPCDPPPDGFVEGNFQTGLMRMSVWG